MNDPASDLRVAILQNVATRVKQRLQSTVARLLVRHIRPWFPYRLRIVDRVQAKRQLRLVRFPAARAHLDLDILRLDRQRLQFLQLVSESTSVAFRDTVLPACIFARHSSPVGNHARHQTIWRFFPILTGSHLPSLIVLLLEELQAL